MENIRRCILDFIEAEFNCNHARYDVLASDKDYEVLAQKAYSFMHSVMSDPFGRGAKIEDIKSDEAWLERYNKKKQKILPRALFQIKQYRHPELGEGLVRWVLEEDLYACYTSYTENTGRPLGYNKLFYVAHTNEGLKIIYDLTYGVQQPGWRHAHDQDINRVAAPGMLVAEEKYKAPQEDTSLADYNKI